jgi:hypothetical protein
MVKHMDKHGNIWYGHPPWESTLLMAIINPCGNGAKQPSGLAVSRLKSVKGSTWHQDILGSPKLSKTATNMGPNTGRNGDLEIIEILIVVIDLPIKHRDLICGACLKMGDTISYPKMAVYGSQIRGQMMLQGFRGTKFEGKPMGVAGDLNSPILRVGIAI